MFRPSMMIGTSFTSLLVEVDDEKSGRREANRGLVPT